VAKNCQKGPSPMAKNCQKGPSPMAGIKKAPKFCINLVIKSILRKYN